MMIRTVVKKDIETCYLIEKKCFEKSEAASFDSIAKRADTYPAGFLVAQIDNQVVGMVNSGATDKDDITDEDFKKLIGHTDSGKNIVVFSVCVFPEFQGNKIASDLIEHFIKRSKELRKEKILLLCKHELIEFYEKLGFTYSGISTSTHGGFEWHEMIYNIC